MYLDPYTLQLFAKERQREILQQVEHRRLVALARAGREDSTLLQRTRRLTGAVLIRVGEWLQGARRADRLAPAALEPTGPAGLTG